MPSRPGTFFLAILCSAQTGLAANYDGQFDSTFGTSGRELFSLYAYANNDTAVVLESTDGKLIVGGACNDICIARLLPDGTFDKSFGPDGFGYLDFNSLPGMPQATFSDAVVLPDGRIAVLAVYSPNSASVAEIFVIRADGTGLDSSVGAGSGELAHVFLDNTVDSAGGKIRLQSDGNFIVAATQVRSDGEFLMVARVLSDLSGLDTTFGTSGVTTVGFGLNGPGATNFDYLSDLALQADGKIVIGGRGETNEPGFYIEIARLLTNGQRDPSFGPDADGRFYGGAAGTLYEPPAIAIDARQNIVYGSGVGNDEWLLARLLPNGQVDPNFNGGSEKDFSIGFSGPQAIKRVMATSDSIIVAGTVPRSGADYFFFSVARLNLDGTLATSFGNGGYSYASFAPPDTSTVSDNPTAAIVTTRGIVVAGQVTTSSYDQFGIARLQYDHIFASTFE